MRASNRPTWPHSRRSWRAGAGTVLAAATEPGERDVALGLLDEAAGQAELAVAYGRYQELLAERGLVDFGDQIAVALRLLRERAVGPRPRS